MFQFEEKKHFEMQITLLSEAEDAFQANIKVWKRLENVRFFLLHFKTASRKFKTEYES